MAKGYYSVDEAAAKMGVSKEELLRSVSTAGIKKFQDQGQLVFKSEDIDRLATGGKPVGESVFQSSSSGLFDVDDLMAELGTATDKNKSVGGLDEPTVATPRPPLRPKASESGSGAVMSDSGLFDVKELVKEAEIISKNLVPDDSTVIDSPGKKKSAGAGAVMSDSGLFEMQEAVGAAPPPPPAARQMNRGAMMSDSGVFNVQSSVAQFSGSGPIPPAAPPSAPAAAAPAPAAPPPAMEGALSSGAVMSDSGLFDVRDLVAEAGGKVQSGAYSAPARFTPGTGQSDSGLFSAAEVQKAAAKPGDEERTRIQAPVKSAPPAPQTPKAPPPGSGARGITIFDPEDFNQAAMADANAATAAVDPRAGLSVPAPARRPDQRSGSGAGLRSPAQAKEGTSLGNQIIGGIEDPTMMQNPNTPLSSSAIFGAQGGRASPNVQTEIMDAVPGRPTTSGIFGSAGRVSPNMQTEILDAQPVEESSEASEASESGSTGEYEDTDTQSNVRSPTQRMAPAARPTQAGRPAPAGAAAAYVEEPDALEPAFGFFLLVSLVLLVLGAILSAYTLFSIKPEFVKQFYDNAKIVMISTGVVLVLGLIVGMFLGKSRS